MNILRIAIVGFNYEQSKRAMKEIANIDCSKIERMSDKSIEMNDGTKYYIFPTYNHVRGYCIDQLIIVDDYRWEVLYQEEELIDWIKYRMMHSCVPEEFKIQKYEW
jgi:predicted HAD superfamily hydrolase